MTAGLQTFNADGSLQIDVTTELTRVVAVLPVSKTATVTQQLPEGRPWWFVTPAQSASFIGSGYSPLISVDGNNLMTISPNNVASLAAVDVTVVVGVY